MILFVLLLIIISFYKAKPILNTGFHSDSYVNQDETKSINGIFIILILFSHTFARVEPLGTLDNIYSSLRIFLGQFIVVPFLFYSGYGIMESIKNKKSYIKSFPKKRLLNLFVQFFFITIFYIILNLCLNNKYTLPEYLLSFIGLTSIGNGGWYMFVTFMYYIFVIIAFNLVKNNNFLATTLVTLLLVILMFGMIFLNFPSYYYSTMIFFSIGMYFSLLKKQFNYIATKNNIIYFVLLIISIIGFILSKSIVSKYSILYPIWCSFGMLTILLFTLKIKIKNKILIYLGESTFFIFTLQGIPQKIFDALNVNNNYLYYILVIITTILIVEFAKCINNYLNKLIANRHKKSHLTI